MQRPPIRRVEPPLLPLRWRLFHWGPITAMSIIACICITTSYCHMMWWPPEKSWLGLFDLLLFLFWVYSCLSNLLRASYVGPGYVPLGWHPANPDDNQYLQLCEHCDGFKVPRAHHCRQCKRCVMKMDHHCPWINNCTGHSNHGYFVAFLLFAVIGCIQATVVLGSSIYYGVFRVWYHYYGTGREPKVELGLYGLFAAVFSFGLAVGVIIAVGFLFIMQMRSILRNRTGIEEYIIAKANQRERDEDFIYPYDLGWKTNLLQVITWDLAPLSDGITWPVKEECNQYTFTMEQIEQKRLKRMLAVEYEAVKPYKGGWYLSRDQGGCGATCSQPFFVGDVRLKLEQGDRLTVTRWRRHWLYGEKHFHMEKLNGSVNFNKVQRGWFPRRCVAELVNEESDNDNELSSATSDQNNALIETNGNVAFDSNTHPKTE